MTGILKNNEKVKFAASIAAVVMMIGGAITGITCGLVHKQYENTAKSTEKAYFAKNTEIAYQLQEGEINDLVEKFENGTLTFGEYVEQSSEIQSEKYIKDKTEELMSNDAEYQENISDIEKKDKVVSGVTIAAVSTMVAGGLSEFVLAASGKKKENRPETELE